jgi:hypothetical protein
LALNCHKGKKSVVFHVIHPPSRPKLAPAPQDFRLDRNLARKCRVGLGENGLQIADSVSV